MLGYHRQARILGSTGRYVNEIVGKLDLSERVGLRSVPAVGDASLKPSK